jgi:LPPG:FO 2-phospho-L-lactate transferase
MRELGVPVTAGAIARHYRELLDGFILDDTDRAEADPLIANGLAVGATHTVMTTLEDRVRLAGFALGFAAPR